MEQSETAQQVPPVETPPVVELKAVEEIKPAEKPRRDPNINPRTKKPIFSEKALAAAKRQFDLELSVAPEDGVVVITDKTAIKAAKKLGWSDKKWGVAAMRAKLQLGQWFNHPINIRKIAAITTMDSIQQAEDVMAACQKLANGEALYEEDGSPAVKKRLIVNAADRAKAGQAFAMAAEAHSDMVKQLLDIAERSEAKNRANGDGQPPMNKPPNLGLEMTSADGVTVRAAATSGS